jgi:hypothetical protein
MEKSEIDIQKLREQIRKGLDLTFQKLLIQKKLKMVFLFYQRKVKLKRLTQLILIINPTALHTTQAWLQTYRMTPQKL